MITEEAVLNIVKRQPIIPNEIRKIIGEGDTYIIGAILSELSRKGIIKISNTKIGGSPFYYVKGNEFQLESIVKYLNEKDRRTFEKLKFEKVLRDSEQEPLVRVSLRNIKDFSKPIEVNTKNGKILFFKYFLVSNSDAENLIKQNLGMKIPRKKIELKVLSKSIEKNSVNIVREKQETVIEEKNVEIATSDFEIKVEDYFRNKKIDILEKEIVRRKSEIDYIINIPSPAGKLTYLCKARNKKKFNDKDLSAAFVEGQEKKLPILFLITGDLTNKAEAMLENKFRNITVNKL